MRTIIMLTATAALAAGGAALAHGPEDHSQHGQQAKPAAVAYGQPGDPKKRSRDILVVMKEADGRMLFVPDRITVKTGEQIRFRLQNEGVLEHEFLLGTQDEINDHAEMMKVMPDMAHDDPNAKRLAARKSGDILWHFTKSGEFDFACLIPGHREAGMSGKIVVK